MMLRHTLLLVITLFLTACGAPDSSDLTHSTNQQKSPDLIIYSGITMVRPLNELVHAFEKQHNIKIEIKQGASGYLYKTIKNEHKGDLFFPGSDSYRIKNAQDGFLKDYVFVGYNRLSLMVAKGNPKNITSDLTQLTNPELSVVLSSPESGAVGRYSKVLLDKNGLTDEVFDNVTYFTTDSHRIFNAIQNGDADIAINWYASSKWPETQEFMQAIILPDSVSPPRRLELNLLSFSERPALAKQFMAFASSKQGLQTFAKFGFLTETELQDAINAIDNQKNQTSEADKATK